MNRRTALLILLHGALCLRAWPHELEIRIARTGGRLLVEVAYEDGFPAAGAELRVFAGGETARLLECDSRGRAGFELGGSTAGRIEARHGGHLATRDLPEAASPESLTPAAAPAAAGGSARFLGGRIIKLALGSLCILLFAGLARALLRGRSESAARRKLE